MPTKKFISVDNVDVREWLEEKTKHNIAGCRNIGKDLIANLQISHIEYPLEYDGCPGETTKMEGTYKGKPFDIFINFDTEEEEFSGDESVREVVHEFMWSGDFITLALWHGNIPVKAAE